MFQPLYVRSLSADEIEMLQARRQSASREEAMRAQAILLSSEGLTASEVSQQLGAHPTNIKKWLRRFNEAGLEGIAVKKRGPQGGPRPRFTSFQTEEIVRLASRPPTTLGYPFKSWTPQKLATAAMERGIVEGISHVTVRQLLKRHEPLSGNEKSPAGMPPAAEAQRLHGRWDSQAARGERELGEYHYEAAVASFEAALSGEPMAIEEEARVRSLLSKALEELSKYDEAYKVIERYEDQRLTSSLPLKRRGRLRLRLGWVHSFLGNYPKAIAALNEAKRLFIEIGDDLGVSEAHYALGRTYIEINEFRIARDHLVTAASNQKTALDRELLAQIYRRLGTVDFSEGAFSSSKQHYLKALELAEGSPNTNLIGGILMDIGTTLFEGYPGEKQEAINYLQRGIAYLEKGGHKDYLALACNNLGDILKDSGQWEEALRVLTKALFVAEQFAKPSHQAMARITMADILCAQGKYVEAEEHLHKSLDMVGGSSDKWLESGILRTLAAVHRGAGRYEAALKTLRQTLQLSTSVGDLYGLTRAMVGLAEFYISQGGLEQAREYLELAQGRLKEEMYLPVSGLIQRLNGQLESAHGRLAEAKQHIAQSISIFTTTELPFDLARSNYEMGLLLKKARDLKGATANLKQARAIFEKLGAEPDLELTDKALATLSQGEDGAQAIRVNPQNDVLLMQRLIEASASRELLVQELAAVIFENFSVERVVICRLDESGQLEPLATQGITRGEADRLCELLEFTNGESITRKAGGFLFKICENSRMPIAVYVGVGEAFDASRLQPLLKQAELGLETCSLRAAARGAITRDSEQRVQTIMPGFIVASAPMFDVIDKIYKIRTSDVTVLITGESGTGKELVARHIHGQSARARAIFLPFNCTATPKEIIDSQLFGHRRGSFTGATANYPGIIKAAEGGTLFLDEIGDLSLEVQPKLMRFLQEGEIQPLGETKPLRVDVRIIAATNADLERDVEDGRFREDLFHRLNIIRIHVPPLRDRREEVPVLAAHFLDHFSTRSGRQGVIFMQESIDALIAYDWPGNVRQLRNEIERVIAYAYDGARISLEDLSPEVVHPRRPMESRRPPSGFERSYQSHQHETHASNGNGHRPKPPAANGSGKLKDATAALERQLIEEALQRNKSNLSRTAIDLGLSRRGLRLKMAQLGVQREERV
ncbi:MAG: sigma 54-interacting transcriptional regulator [Blastocatellia bacterium]